MSLRQVLTIYNAERQLSDDEMALLNTLRKMTDAERGMFVDGLSDKPQKKSSERVVERCNICNYTRRAKHHSDQTQRDYHEFEAPQSSKKSAGERRSTRGESIKSQLDSQRQQREARTLTVGDDCAQCDYQHDHNIHHRETMTGYHPFVSTAQPAEPSSNQATSETGKGGAGDAHHVASSGD